MKEIKLRLIEEIIKVIKENIKLLEKILDAFRNDLEKLVELTHKYPVEVEFSEYRLVFSTREEIVWLISLLDCKIKQYYSFGKNVT